jgi:hypothetical protein
MAWSVLPDLLTAFVSYALEWVCGVGIWARAYPHDLLNIPKC